MTNGGVAWCDAMWYGVVWCGVVWCGVVWCGVVWCGVVWCGVVWCGVVWCGVVWCGVVWCGVVWCGVVWCGVVWCGVVWCGVVCRRRCYQRAKGRDVYPRVKVNGLGCVCCVRAVRKCVGLGRGRGSRGDLVSSPLATALFPGAPAAPLPFLLAGAGVAPATPTPSCCPGPGSATPATHCRTTWERRAVQLLQCTASLPEGSGQCNSCNALPHCLGAVGSGTAAMHCLTALGQ